MNDWTSWLGPAAGAITVLIVAVAHAHRFAGRMTRLFDPLVRWWTAGALTDQVQRREREILAERIKDLDRAEAEVTYLRRWARKVVLKAAENDWKLPPLMSGSTYRREYEKNTHERNGWEWL